jgi:IclR family transcriptional regulator, acetate operon repressor
MNESGTACVGEQSSLGNDQRPPSAVDKAMALLSTLISDGRPMSLAELTRRTGLPKTTVHRLIGVLRAHNVVDRHEEAYVPGELLAEVSGAADGRYLRLLGRVAKPFLVDLYQSTGAIASLGVLSGDEVRYVDRVFSHQSVRTPSFRSDRAPAHCTAIGKILLAQSHHSSRVIHEGQPLPALTQATITAPADLMAELAKVRREGIAYSSAEYVNGVVCVAVLVARESARRPAVAVSVGGRVNDFDLAAARMQLPRTALALSQAIREATARVAPVGAVHHPQTYAPLGMAA